MAENRIRISFMPNYPFVNPKCPHMPHFRASSYCQMPGFAAEILYLLTTYLNLTIDVIKVTRRRKNYKLVFDEIDNNETDTYAILYNENTIDNKNQFNFTNEVFMVYRFFDRSIIFVLVKP